jgi:dipeptidase D
MANPLNDPIQTYVENGWMKARGTSLGADNGIGLSMALAVLEDDTIVHPALEVMTTTNEEDGMSGAAALSKDFLKGRKVINLDSEDYDTITTGAAGATLQFHRLPFKPEPTPAGKHRWYHIHFEGGLGGHSGVDINKGRCSAVIPTWAILAAIYNEYDFHLARIDSGEANASIASHADIIICVPSGEACEFVKSQQESINQWLREEYGQTDPNMTCTIEKCAPQDSVIPTETFEALMHCLEQTPQGVVKMSKTMKDTVETSNNVGRITTESNHLFISTHTRSFIDADMAQLSADIANTFATYGGQSETVMSAPA